MDPLSVTASIIAVLTLTSEVVTYLNDVENASKDCRKCAIEAASLYSLLTNLRFHLDEPDKGESWNTSIRALAVENGPLDQYRQALLELQSQVTIQDGVAKVKARLLWKFNKAEVEGILRRMERMKSHVSVALELAHLNLSKTIKTKLGDVSDTVTSVQADVTTIRKVQQLQQDAQQVRQHEKIMQWLSPIDFAAQQHDIISRREEGTGQWFLDSIEFKTWQQGVGKTLFCQGMPGAGKTMIAAIAVDHLRKRAREDSATGFAYLFCTYKPNAEQTCDALLAVLLKHLAQKRSDLADAVFQMYEKHQKEKTTPLLDEIFTALQTICSLYTTVYIVVDALDECSIRQATTLIEKLGQLQTRADVRIMYTSRVKPEIKDKVHCDITLEVRAREQDVRQYVAGQSQRLPKCIQEDDQLRQDVQDGIAKAVDGMFLLARLHVDFLLDKRTKKVAKAALQTLQKGGGSLDSAYDEAVQRIEGQPPGDTLLAKQALSWITYARRPLTVQELCYALAIEADTHELDGDAIPMIEDILSVCAGLLTVDNESNIVRLVHYTTQEYLEQIRLKWIPSAQRDIAVSCLTYLSMHAFVGGPCNSDEAFEERLRNHVLLDYTACHWAGHTEPVQEAVSDLATKFLCNDALILVAAQTAHYDRPKWGKIWSQKYPRYDTGLYLTARYGLTNLTGILLQEAGQALRIDLKENTSGRTPFSLAAENGHEAIVKLLLDTGKVDVDVRDDKYYRRTPFSLAAENGHEAIVKLLLDTGKVDVDAREEYYYRRTPLSYAAENGHEAIVKLLLDTGKVDVDARDEYRRTPLSWAAENGHEAIVKLLLDTGKVDVDARDDKYYRRTPLSYAAENGHEAVVKLLQVMV